MSKRLILLVAASLLAFVSPKSTVFAQESGGGAATKNNLDLPFDAGGKSEEEEEAPEIVIFYGQQYEGDGIFFCCDRSGSMAGAKWQKLQREVVKNITQFSERVQFALVFFDAGMVKFPASGRPADANPAMKAAGVAMVMSTQTGHGTCQKPALFASLNFANQSSAKRKLIIYLSDGFSTCPNGGDAATYGQQALSETTQRNTQRVHINTICIGVDVDEDWMKKLASMNNGQYARIVE